MNLEDINKLIKLYDEIIEDCKLIYEEIKILRKFYDSKSVENINTLQDRIRDNVINTLKNGK